MADAKARSAPPPPRAEIRPREPVQRPGRDLERRLRLDSRRKLARSAARSLRPARRNPCAARGGECLCRGNPRPYAPLAAATRARNAGAAEGGRQRTAGSGRTLLLLFAFSPRRSASDLLPPARARAARKQCCSTAMRARAGNAFFHLGGARHSPDHLKFAWSADDKGAEMYAIGVRDLAAEIDLTTASRTPAGRSSGRATPRRSSIYYRTNTIVPAV